MLDKVRNLFGGLRQMARGSTNASDTGNATYALSFANDQQLWLDMYAGRSPWLNREVKNLHLPEAIASEIARLATIEMKVAVDGSARADYLNNTLRPILSRTRIITEFAAAGGSVAIKPYVAGGGIAFDVMHAGWFRPTAYDSFGAVFGCLFAAQIIRGDKVYTRHEHHEMTDEGVRVANRAYVRDADSTPSLLTGRVTTPFARMFSAPGDEIPLRCVEEWAGIEPEAVIPTDRPLFAILRMPFANSCDPQSPEGVSIYARAVGLIEEADRQFSRLIWEMESGSRAVFVDEAAISPSSQTGGLPLKRLYRTLDVGLTDKALFEQWSPQFRIAEQRDAMNEILRRIEDSCGLASGTFSDAPESGAGGAKTATEIRVMRQRTYATIVDVQRSVETALRDLICAIDAWATVAKLAPQGAWTVAFDFDDSVISDRANEFAERMQLVSLGAMTLAEMRAWYLGEPLELAEAALDRTETDLTIPGE